MPRKLRDSVVVITGASSGIGRASARAFAQQGATVVLTARREAALDEVAAECRNLGGRAQPIAADITDEGAVRGLARHAIEEFGRIDTWVNNAAVSQFGRFEETPPEAFRRVIDTNLLGYVHGARAALPYFREQGSGVLINNSSVVASTGQPFTTAYTVSKAAIRTLAECLRAELLDAPDIHVCTVLPASIDTPLFAQAANYFGRAVKPIQPIISPERVARAIVGLARRPRRERFVGGSGRLLALQYALAPRLGERLMARQVLKQHFQDLPAAPSAGNLYQPLDHWTGVDGGWKAPRPANGRAALFAGLALAALPAALLAWRQARR